MRILYDANVLLKILSRRESILEFKKSIERDRIIIITSRHILSEVEAVLVEKFKLTKQKAKATVRLLEKHSVVVNPENVENVSRDRFDDYVIAAAVVGKVKYLVTEDKDLLVLKKHMGIKVIRFAEFKKVLDG